MIRASLILFLLLCEIFSVRSTNPLYTKKDILIDDKIVGTWSNDDKAKWKFTKEGEGYKLALVDKNGNNAEFDVHLLTLGKYKFMDIYLTRFDHNVGKNLDECGLLHPFSHAFMRVDSIDNEMKLKTFNSKWLEKTVEKNPDLIKHNKINKNNKVSILLTAETSELQSFILKNAEGEAFKSEFVLKQMNKPLSE
ncbi:MAG TPA: hypothetical protein PLW02_01100 [Verrucomicrobiota bacterium]|nr:hypothetical protein [Verrucomicrobiota bacterium]